MKSAQTPAMKAVTLPDGYHYVYGVVYSPLAIDSDWETMTAEDIRKMAHEFITSGKVRQIDVKHDRIESGAEVVESFIARPEDPDFPEGSWVLGVRMPEGPLWNAVKSGELNGFSVDALVTKVPKRVLVDLVKIALGSTEMNSDMEILPPHQHEYYVEFNGEGRVIEGFTDEVLGHVHRIAGTVMTEDELGHSHRYFVE